MSRVEKRAQHYTDTAQFSTIEWVIKRENQILYSGAKGFDEETNPPGTADSPIYRIYSMTKPLISVLAVIFIQQQKIRLSDPVAKFLPTVKDQKILRADGTYQQRDAEITIEHLLIHTAGFSYDFLPDCPVAELYREAELTENGSRSLEQLCDALCAFPLASQPGDQWIYSYSIDVLARIIEIVSNLPIDQVLREYLTTPLGMLETDYSLQRKDQHRLLPMFGSRRLGDVAKVSEEQQILTQMDVSRSYPATPKANFGRGGIGLFSTLTDYLLFCDFLHTGASATGEKILCNSLFDMMWANRIPQHLMPLKIGATPYPGYGWNLTGRIMLDIGQAIHLTVPFEAGWAGAASTWYWVDRKNTISGVVMTQYLGSDVPLGPDIQAAAYTDIDLLAD